MNGSERLRGTRSPHGGVVVSGPRATVATVAVDWDDLLDDFMFTIADLACGEF